MARKADRDSAWQVAQLDEELRRACIASGRQRRPSAAAVRAFAEQVPMGIAFKSADGKVAQVSDRTRYVQTVRQGAIAASARETSPETLAFMCLGHPVPQIRALANALQLAISHHHDQTDPEQQRRVEAAQAASDFVREVRNALQKLDARIEPMVEHNVSRNAELGANAAIFESHDVPERVARIRGRVAELITELEQLAGIVKHQLHLPEMLPSGRGRPVDHVANEISSLLRTAGLSHAQIGRLTDNETGDKAKRVRHRVGVTRRSTRAVARRRKQGAD